MHLFPSKTKSTTQSVANKLQKHLYPLVTGKVELFQFKNKDYPLRQNSNSFPIHWIKKQVCYFNVSMHYH